jgi:hypothetical protein
MDQNFIISVTPSKANDFLRSFLGKRVSRLVRYSWWAAEEVGSQCGILDEQVFSLTAGPLVVCFEDGAILGLASDPTLNSIIVWNEAARRSADRSTSLDEDDELYAIPDSGRFAGEGWRNFTGRDLRGFTILKRSAMSLKEQERPSEVGLRFEFDGGARFVASHGLQDGSDDFSVLEGSQLPEIELEEIPIS